MSYFKPGDYAVVSHGTSDFKRGETVLITETAACGARRVESLTRVGTISRAYLYRANAAQIAAFENAKLPAPAPTPPTIKWKPGQIAVLESSPYYGSKPKVAAGTVVKIVSLEPARDPENGEFAKVRTPSGLTFGVFTRRFIKATQAQVDQYVNAVRDERTPKYKVGDKVRVLSRGGEDGHIFHYLTVGSIATVVEVLTRSGNVFARAADGQGQYVHPNDLELVEVPTPAPAPAPKANPIPYLPRQAKLVLRPLLEGKSMTRLSAMFDFKVANITARIADLRNAGIEVDCTIKRDPNGNKYGEWSIGKTERNRVLAVMAHA